MKGIIYIATNLFSGRSYIGQTRTTLERRMSQHFRDSRTDQVNHFHLALAQYGRSGFEWNILDEFEGSKEEVIHALNVAEEYHILKNKTMLEEYGYNATRGGYSSDVFSSRIHRLANRGGKSILQYSLEGVFIKEFASISDVALEFGCKSVGTSIFSKQWRGYQWRRRESLQIPREIGAYVKPKRSSEVIAYSPEGEFYKEYPSISQCSKDLGKQYSIREFTTQISRPSYLRNSILVFRKREGEYPKSIAVTYVPPKTKEVSSYESTDIPVVQYSRDGDRIRVFPSIIDAHRETGVSEKSIRDWCKRIEPLKIRSARTEYIWRYKTNANPDKINVADKESKGYIAKMEHRIVQYSRDGSIIKIWNNMHTASLESGESPYLIKRQCEGMPTKKRTASIWKYYESSVL